MAKATGLRRLRINRGLTQQQLGIALNVTRTAVHNWETGKAVPSIPNAVKLGNLFNKDFTEIRNLSKGVSSETE
jgi:DNA-binding XRE family transcriptional regulator